MTEVEIFKQSLDVSRIVMILTILMTIVSATFSALTLAFQRSHNRKSVKPLCDLVKIVNGNCLSVNIKNAGLGPMIIHDILINEEENKNIAFNIFCEQTADDYPGLVTYKKIRNNKMILSVNESMEIIKLNLIEKDMTSRKIMQRLEKTEITIEYCDIYDKQHSVTDLLVE
jgi:hypothetical protein